MSSVRVSARAPPRAVGVLTPARRASISTASAGSRANASTPSRRARSSVASARSPPTTGIPRRWAASTERAAPARIAGIEQLNASASGACSSRKSPRSSAGTRAPRNRTRKPSRPRAAATTRPPSVCASVLGARDHDGRSGWRLGRRAEPDQEVLDGRAGRVLVRHAEIAASPPAAELGLYRHENVGHDDAEGNALREELGGEPVREVDIPVDERREHCQPFVVACRAVGLEFHRTRLRSSHSEPRFSASASRRSTADHCASNHSTNPRPEGTAARGDPRDLDPHSLLERDDRRDPGELLQRLESGVADEDEVGRRCAGEQRGGPAGTDGCQHPQLADVGAPRRIARPNRLDGAGTTLVGHDHAFRKDDGRVAPPNAVREHAELRELGAAVVGVAIDEVVAESIPDDVETGVEEEFVLEDVDAGASPLARGATRVAVSRQCSRGGRT